MMLLGAPGVKTVCACMLNLPSNEGAARRTGTIRIGAGSRHAEIHLMQEMDNFRVFTPDGNDTLVFIPKGGTIDLPVEYTVV